MTTLSFGCVFERGVEIEKLRSDGEGAESTENESEERDGNAVEVVESVATVTCNGRIPR